MRFPVPVVIAFLLSGCAIPNPKWRGLSESARCGLRGLQANRTRALYGDRESFDALPDDEKKVIICRDLIDESEYLYSPKPVKSWRGGSFNQLKFAWIADTGTDDPGEIDLFEDDELSVALDLYGGDWVPDRLNFAQTKANVRWRNEHWSRSLIPRAIGLTASLGGGTTTGGNDDQVLFGVVAAGVFVEWFEFLGLEGGYFLGVSPDGSLDDTQRDDSAWYYGIRLDTKRLGAWAEAGWDYLNH